MYSYPADWIVNCVVKFLINCCAKFLNVCHPSSVGKQTQGSVVRFLQMS